MSRRRRTAKKGAVRAQIAWKQVLRRRARAIRGACAATAATAAAVALPGVGTAFPGADAGDAAAASGGSGSALRQCPTPPMPSSAPRELAAVGDVLFFSATDGIHGRELWKTDGTEAGTVLVKNINPHDSDRGRSSRPRDLTAAGGTLFFTAKDGTRGRELWKSDGSRAGTVLVKDINPAGHGDPGELTPVGNRFFFTAYDRAHGRELWKSDGSRAGTVLVKNISPRSAEPYYGSPHHLAAMGHRVFFAANGGVRGTELWRSNGTTRGTVLVKDIDPIERNNHPDAPGSRPGALTAVRGRLFFNADDGARGRELWTSDGSTVGTVLVKDVKKGRSGSEPYLLTRWAGRLYFAASGGGHGRELWKSDGTRAGTDLVKDINPDDSQGGQGSHPDMLTAVRDQLFFAADDGRSGAGLWKSDGTRTRTVLVRNVDIDSDRYPIRYPARMEALQDRVFFAGGDGASGEGLWRSDGSTPGTVLVKDFESCDDSPYPGSNPSYLTGVGDSLFFVAEDVAHGEELWKSNGRRAGTVLVKDIRAAAEAPSSRR